MVKLLEQKKALTIYYSVVKVKKKISDFKNRSIYVEELQRRTETEGLSEMEDGTIRKRSKSERSFTLSRGYVHFHRNDEIVCKRVNFFFKF